MGLLGAMAGVLVVWAFLYLADFIALLDKPDTSPVLVVLGAVPPLMLCLPTLTIFIVWLYRCAGNAAAFGARDLRFKPAVAVWSWFIPYVNNALPYLVVREVWLASDPRTPISTRQTRRGVGALALSWWLCSYFTFSAVYLAFYFRITISDPEADTGLNIFGAISRMALAASAVLAIVLVMQLVSRQEQRSRLSANPAFM